MTPIPAPSELKMNEEFVTIAKFLGVWSKPDFDKYHDKVWDIYEWAKKRTGSNDVSTIIDCLKERINYMPSINNMVVLDLWLSTKLDEKKTESAPADPNTKEDLISFKKEDI